MERIKSILLLVVVASLVAAVFFGLKIGLPLCLFCLALAEYINAKDAVRKKQFALASVGAGVFLCIFAIVSIANVL